MSLILAIEPDRRQVAHLISIVRHVQGAELILADTTERALESIGNSVPDLILVPALLSPQDDAALAAALRVIAHAAHVQMLTIPTFATPKPTKKKGVLSALLRKSADEAPLDGCDPKVFAEEIASYLERATEERAAAQYYDDEPAALESEAPQRASMPADDAAPVSFQREEPEPYVADWTPDAPPAVEQYVEPYPVVEQYREDNGSFVEPFAVAPDASPEPGAASETIFAQDADEPVFVSAADAPIVETSAAADAYVEYTSPASVEHEPVDSPVVELTSAEPWQAETANDEALAAESPVAEAAPLFEEEQIAELEPAHVEEPEEAFVADPIAAAADVEQAAPDSFVEAFEPASSDFEEAPALAAASPVVQAPQPAAPARVSEFEDFLADFERANMPVIEEIRAEPWMSDGTDTLDDTEEEDAPTDVFTDDELVDIDLSIELDAVLHTDEPASAPQPPQPAALKPFEPVVPVERVEPFPLAAWHAWPRLDWTPPEKPAVPPPSENGAHAAPINGTASAADFDQIVEFEEALEAEEAARLEPFEAVLPAERVEPMPLSAWHAWPRLEGVASEAYQEPIAPRKAAAKPEWVELMRSLREDIARRRAELVSSGPIAPPPPQPRVETPRQPVFRAQAVKPPARQTPTAPQPAPAPAPTTASASASASASKAASSDAQKKRLKRTRPIEDEWGLFDPEQCGFAALLDKLDEITVAAAAQQHRRQTR
jgi:hypothetical protein